MLEANPMASFGAPQEKSQDIFVGKSEAARAGEQVEYTAMDGDHTAEEEEPVVTLKTWVVVFVRYLLGLQSLSLHFLQILSMGYGLSFWPIPVIANIGGLLGREFNAPTEYVWFIPVSNSFHLLRSSI
jgi:hypothetical protein